MEYVYFKNQKKFYEYIDNLLKDGYTLKSHYFLAYLFVKDDKEILVSPLKIKNIDNYQEELEKYRHNYEIIYPNYDDTNLNIIAGIKKNFGDLYQYQIDEEIFDKKYEHIVLLLLDGLGKNVIENNLDENSFLRKHCFKYVNSIFPSTTACATTAIKAGITPIETAWTGWHNYFKEIDKDIILFTGINYYNKHDKDQPAYKMIPYEPYFKHVYEPNFRHVNFDDTLKRSLDNIVQDKVQYVYHTEPDNLMHQIGTYAKNVKKMLAKIDKKVEEYAHKLPDNTLLLVVADHGHIPIYKGISFYYHKEIFDMLKTLPSNDTRCLVFRVKDEYKDSFKSKFMAYYEDIYDIYETNILIEKGFFGNPNKAHKRIKEFLGDFIAIAKSDYLLYTKKDNDFRSHHAGYTKEEMLVPIIVYKK